MFHTNQFITNKAFPYEKTVTEIKAPTDDSIRLWNEMLNKARKSLIQDCSLKNNKINLSAALFENPHKHYTRSITYMLIINGIEFNGLVELNNSEITPRIIHIKIIEDLSKDIARNLIKLL